MKQRKQTKAEIALRKFGEGFHCAQSIACAFANDVHIDENIMVAFSTGFGAGMSRCQEVCGAVSSAVIVLSAKFGDNKGVSIERTEKIYTEVQKFIEEFKKEKGTINCFELLSGCDLITEEGRRMFMNSNLRKECCSNLLVLACNILEKRFAEIDKENGDLTIS